MVSNVKKWLSGVHRRIFSVFVLDNNSRIRVSEIVREDSTFGVLYWIQMVLSSVIASFGLLQNSVAVVIGAMLIAPLLRPMQGMAFAVMKGDGAKFWHNLKILFFSVIIGAGVGYLATLITPIRFETAEVLARTSPNILDLFIAIASAVIAFLSLSYKKLSASLAGVAMAAALVPPLSVVGISLALGNFTHAWGSMFLFITNVLAIILVGVLVFFMYGFEPYYQEDKRDAFRGFSILIVLVLIISVPLTSTLIGFSRSLRIEKAARVQFETTLLYVLPTASVTSFVAKSSNEQVEIDTAITLPEDETFYAELQETISNSLSEVLDKDVAINFEIIRSAVAVTKKDLSESRLLEIEQSLKNALRQKLKQYASDADILNMEVTQFDIVKQVGKEKEIEAYTIRTVTSDFPSAIIGDIEKDIRELFANLQISFVWKNISADGGVNLEKNLSSVHKDKVIGDVRRVILPLLQAGQEIDEIQVLWVIAPEYSTGDIAFNPEYVQSYVLNIDMNLPRDTAFNLNVGDKKQIEEQLGKGVRVNMRKFFYDRIVY